MNQTPDNNVSFQVTTFGDNLLKKDEFYSLLMERNEHCRSSSWTVWLSTGLMVGAIFGSFSAGFIADLSGRVRLALKNMHSSFFKISETCSR